MEERRKITKFNRISSWLSNSVSESEDKRYVHRLIKEHLSQRDLILDELISIVQKAHEDTRSHLRRLAGNSLAPFSDSPEIDPCKGYPESLNIITLQGYFGEIFAGIVAENFSHFGYDDWEVPAFMFRFHLVELQNLEYLNQTGEIAKKRPGRTGDDCLAFRRNSEGVIIASLFCEAKCTTSDNHQEILSNAHQKVSTVNIKPVDILRLIEILQDYDDRFSSEWVNSLRVLRLGKSNGDYERFDLVSYTCDRHPKRPKTRTTWIYPPNKRHEKYIADRKLEAVEIHLHNVENLIQAVYVPQTSIIRSTDVPTQTVQQPDDSEKIKANSDVIVEAESLQNEMAQPSNEVIALATELQNSLAGSKLTPAIAKLYSQHTRLRAGGEGLKGWRDSEAGERLNDAIRLIEAAFIKREAGETDWRNGMLRAGEILEWLSHPQLNPNNLPIRLLAAAIYELAGYPARAAGLLNEDAIEGIESEILRSLLKADFPNLLQLLTKHWTTALSLNSQVDTSLLWDETDTQSYKFNEYIVNQTASSLGILCAEMRWGNEPRLEKAIEKFSDIAKVLLHGHDTYSWLLGKLCAEVTSVYVKTSLRKNIEALSPTITQEGRNFLERYLRKSYEKCKTLAWRSQICGIERLATAQSFALCTPTGSGKTRIAEIAILQSLFLETNNHNNLSSPLVLYLVPSKALATEVESNLSRVLNSTTNKNVIVTGLYGGTDWGPTDAWLTSDKPTVLICTYEKAEALMKFLGPLFIRRVSLIIIDEAHAVQFDGNKDSLQKAENRALRLESLGARLFTYVEENHSRIIALSAVASETEGALASWTENQSNANPAKTNYRSTRQLIGRLECLPGRGFEIRYDLLDGRRLEFQEGGENNTPFILNPFPICPPAPKGKKDGVEKRLRPHLFWAAMHLAAPDEKGKRRAVLISVPQYIDGYAEDFLDFLNLTFPQVKQLSLFEEMKESSKIEKPSFFQKPTEQRKLKILQKCLLSCKDYFGIDSSEYKLLEKGIVVHHGKMPGLLARLLIEVIEERIVNLVLSTSTLSEGVNLPFETLLIPTLRRRNRELNIREFSNLVGRAGRPGFATEGRSLVLLSNQSADWSEKQARNRYKSLILQLENQNQANNQQGNAISPLAQLLLHLEEQWRHLSSSNQEDILQNRFDLTIESSSENNFSDDKFITWLEQTAPLSYGKSLPEEESSAIETLDSLDSILLAVIVEIEQLKAKDLSPNELEEQLQKIWQRSFAHYASIEQERLENLFIRRGKALKTEIYRDVSQRRRLYRTSLPPRDGNQLLDIYPKLKELLSTGGDYANWTAEQRFKYIQTIVSHLATLSKFRLEEPSGKISWNEILRWWLDPNTAAKQPTAKQVSKWHSYISKNFIYRFNWGLGSIIALAIDEAFGGELVESSLENWSQTGLPWIVFWIKELIVWGTLDPVAAYLLAKVEDVTTRKQAEELARTYYQYISERETEPNEHLNAVNIRNWVEQSFSNVERHLLTPKPPKQIDVNLLKDFSKAPSKNWRIVPVEIGNEIQWFDLAGVPLAICHKPENWQPHFLNAYDFILDVENQIVSSRLYV